MNDTEARLRVEAAIALLRHGADGDTPLADAIDWAARMLDAARPYTTPTR